MRQYAAGFGVGVAVGFAVAALLSLGGQLKQLGYIVEFLVTIIVVLLCIVAVVEMYRWMTRPKVVHIGEHGAYHMQKGTPVPLKPLSVSYNGISYLTPPNPTEMDDEDDYEQDDTIATEPILEKAALAEQDTTKEEEIALQYWNDGSNSRAKLSKAMGVSQHHATQLIAALKAKGRLALK